MCFNCVHIDNELSKLRRVQPTQRHEGLSYNKKVDDSTQVILEQLKGKSLDTCTCYPAHVLLISVYFECCLLEIQLLMTKTVVIAQFKVSSRNKLCIKRT